MGRLRTLVRLPALVVLTAGVLGLIAAGVSLFAVLPGGGGWFGPRAAAWRTTVFHGWSRGVVWIFRVRCQVSGQPPAGGFFLVSNHLSYLDIVVLAAHLRCVFVAKAEIARWPVFGTLCRAGDTVFIDRGNKRDIPRAIASIQRVLSSGRGVVMFPEATSTKGEGVLPFRPALLEPAAEAGLPVSYAALTYRTPPGCVPAHLAVCWWGDMPIVRHLLGLMGLPEVRAKLVFGEERIVDRDRKELARRLEAAVLGSFEPVIHAGSAT